MTDQSSKNETTNPTAPIAPAVDERTLKQLQAELVELGMPAEDVSLLNNKGAVKATINLFELQKLWPRL